ncbi:sulfurtransferase [bacterium]|nr:sulfurtransferase [bacterium]
MKRTKAFLGLFILFVFCVQALAVAAQGDFISPKELTGMMKNDNVIIVSGRKTKDYKKVHIEGAVNVWHLDLYKSGKVKGLIKSPAKLAKIFGKQGISQKKTIVVYDGGKNKTAGRLYWIFKYLGCKDVKILNGGLKSWRKERNALTKKSTKVKAAVFVPKPDKARIASMKYVEKHLKDSKAVIVDARSKAEFAGKKGKSARKGHIPGAISLEFKKIINKNGTVKSKADLEKIFKTAGISSNQEILLYCETSVRAGIIYSALTSILKYKKVKVYDGAFNEWAADSSKPIK